ncbi:multidrug effflux MFS transporter [Microbacterium hominis]|uniref:multidrug effflux MFS transporter n=1 Tax=Microbacterium TaxID=33882 RepID=UPI00168AF4DE|nr:MULTISPECIES: multidrug effflux MFS transporter [Microbacterium]QOC26889.1 multidrug effflux MFS transporter [Microbacterium hominis]QOC28056.1 multidrug effflux MFS transporter [Microbacterium hominis]QYF96777.1 multidrug effflux MFS transporter [Microbacterium sp. PAMC21962]
MTSSTSTAERVALPDANSDASRPITPALLVVLGLLSAIAPFATDLYLPAFPEMAADLQTSETAVQLSLTSFLLGVTAGQLVFGPLSDRLGRVAPLVAGAVLCVAASVIAVFAPTVGVLIAARFVQGLGGAAGMVIGRAIISDLATGRPAARAFSLMMIVGGVAPVIAPLVGGVLTAAIGWRGLLAIVLGLAVVMLVAVLVVVRETHLKERRDALRAERRGSSSGAREMLSRTFIGYAASFAFAFAAMMAYISASPFVYQDMIGLDSAGYGIAFGINALVLMVTSVVSAKLVATRSVRAVLGTGLGGVLVAAVAFAVLAVTAAPVALLAVPLFLLSGSLGFVLGNGTALALAAVPKAAGTASAVVGALQFGLAALVSPLVSLGGSTTAVPLAVVMLAAAVVALAFFAIARPARPRTT